MAKPSPLNVKAFGLTLGILWGAGVLLVGLMAQTGYGLPFVEFLGALYIGYSVTVQGAIIGGLWAFVDAGVGGLIFAWLYNKFLKVFK